MQRPNALLKSNEMTMIIQFGFKQVVSYSFEEIPLQKFTIIPQLIYYDQLPHMDKPNWILQALLLPTISLVYLDMSRLIPAEE